MSKECQSVKTRKQTNNDIYVVFSLFSCECNLTALNEIDEEESQEKIAPGKVVRFIVEYNDLIPC